MQPVKPGLSVSRGVVVRTSVFALPEGDVTLTYPDILAEESMELLKYQVEGIFKALALAKKAAAVLYPDHAQRVMGGCGSW